MSEARTAGRPTNLPTKAALAILADSKYRSVADMAKELGTDAATARDAIRSLSKQGLLSIREEVTFVYRISRVGLDRLAKPQKPAMTDEERRASKTRRETERRERLRAEAKRKLELAAARLASDDDGDDWPQVTAQEVIERARTSRSPLEMAWRAPA